MLFKNNCFTAIVIDSQHYDNIVVNHDIISQIFFLIIISIHVLVLEDRSYDICTP